MTTHIHAIQTHKIGSRPIRILIQGADVYAVANNLAPEVGCVFIVAGVQCNTADGATIDLIPGNGVCWSAHREVGWVRRTWRRMTKFF